MHGSTIQLRQDISPEVNEGYGSPSILEQQCFQMHSQDISTKIHVFNVIINPTMQNNFHILKLGLPPPN